MDARILKDCILHGTVLLAELMLLFVLDTTEHTHLHTLTCIVTSCYGISVTCDWVWCGINCYVYNLELQTFQRRHIATLSHRVITAMTTTGRTTAAENVRNATAFQAGLRFYWAPGWIELWGPSLLFLPLLFSFFTSSKPPFSFLPLSGGPRSTHSFSLARVSGGPSGSERSPTTKWFVVHFEVERAVQMIAIILNFYLCNKWLICNMGWAQVAVTESQSVSQCSWQSLHKLGR